MAITALGHPFGAGEMTLPGTSGAFGLAIRIDVQNDVCDFAPICPFGIGVKETQIRHKMLFIITSQDGLRRSGIGYRRIEWRLGHGIAQ